MTLLHPVWLALAIPLAAAWRIWRLPTRVQRGLRLAALALLLLALADLAILRPTRGGTLVVVADRSRSMPPDGEALQREAIELLQPEMAAQDRLAVVAFGESARLEQSPQSAMRFAGFRHEIAPDASNLTDALELALSLVPRDTPGRLLLLSDGRWTGSDPTSAAARAAARGIAIDHRTLTRDGTRDLAIARIDAPSAVAAGEAFLLTAWVQSPVARTVEYVLKRGDQVLAAGKRELTVGLNRLTFRDRALEGGTQVYSLSLPVDAEDPLPENNRARVLVGVQGVRPLLHVAAGDSGLARLLRAGGLALDQRKPAECEWSLESLSRYSGVVLENVPADTVGFQGMETLAAWVRETGAGLMLTGGRNAYGPGGYYRSPLEPLLPVSMELRNEHRKLSLAIVVALDRSGSMAMPVAGGRSKMDLANLGTAQVLDLLGPMDELGVLAVDTIPHEVVPLASVTDKAAARSKILRIESMGGGIYVHEALVASAKMLQTAKAGTRHIILFADAADAEEPGAYRELIGKCNAAGITISVIGLGKPTDTDGELLKDIARLGKGRIFFTERPEELPRLFAQDTFVVARNTFLDEPTPIKPTAGLAALTGREFAIAGQLGGYNLCYLRSGATLGTVTVDEYRAPVVAAWQAGAGRALCYTGEADGKYAGTLPQWPEVGDYFTSLARWVAGPQGRLPEGMVLTQELNKGVQRLTLYLDPERTGNPFVELPKVSVLRAAGGGVPKPDSPRELHWSGPDSLTLDLPLSGPETALATVSIAGLPPQALPPVCLPYSPEYEPALNDGPAALERLSRATGGQERIDLAGIWRDLPRPVRLVRLAPWLIGAAMVLLLLEVLERRTSWLSAGAAYLYRRRPVEAKKPSAQTPSPRTTVEGREVVLPVPSPSPRPAPTQAPTPASVESGEADMLEALRKARERSRGS